MLAQNLKTTQMSSNWIWMQLQRILSILLDLDSVDFYLHFIWIQSW